MGKTIKKKIIIADIFIISLILGSIPLGFIYTHNVFIDSAFWIIIGVIFMTSNKFRDKLNISKCCCWIAENILKPKTKLNHIIWGLFFIVIGLLPVTATTSSEDTSYYYKNLITSLEFWLIIAFVILFNVLVGLYTSKKNKNIKNC